MKTFRKIKSTRRDRSSEPLEENISFVENYRKSIIDSVKQQVYNEDQTQRFQSGVSEKERARLEQQLVAPHPISEQINVYFDKLNADLELIRNSQSGSRIEYTQLAEDVKNLSRLAADVVLLDEGLGKLTGVIDQIPGSFIDVQSEIDVVRNHIFESESLSEEVNKSHQEHASHLDSKIEEFNNILNDITDKSITEETNAEGFRKRVNNIEIIAETTFKDYENRIAEMQGKVESFNETVKKVTDSAIVREVQQKAGVEFTISELKEQLTSSVDSSLTKHQESIDVDVDKLRVEVKQLLAFDNHVNILNGEVEDIKKEHIEKLEDIETLKEVFKVVSDEIETGKNLSNQRYNSLNEEVKNLQHGQQKSQEESSKFISTIKALTELFDNVETGKELTESVADSINEKYETISNYIEEYDTNNPLLNKIKKDAAKLRRTDTADLQGEVAVLKNRLSLLSLASTGTGGGSSNDVEIDGRLTPFESIQIQNQDFYVDPSKKQLVVIGLKDEVEDLVANVTILQGNVVSLESSNNFIYGNTDLLPTNTALRNLTTLTTNVSILETSNNDVYGNLDLLTSETGNVRSLTTLTTNVSILEIANTDIYGDLSLLTGNTGDVRDLTTLTTNVSILETSNGEIFGNLSLLTVNTGSVRDLTTLTTNVSILEVSNTASFNTANTLRNDFEAANTAANTRITILEASNNVIFGNLALLTANTTGNVRSLSTLTVNVALLEQIIVSNNTIDLANLILSNTAIYEKVDNLEASNTVIFGDLSLLTANTTGNVRSLSTLTVNVNALESSNTTSFNTANTLRNDFEAANTAANTRITILEASNNAIFGNLALLTANTTGNVRSLTTLTTNVSILEASNATSFNTANTLRNDFELANTAANTRISILEASNATSFNTANTLRNDFDSANTRIVDLESANTAANTRITILEASNNAIFGNLALLTANTTGNVRSLSTLTVNVSALEAANTAANTRITILEASNTASFNTANTLRNDFEAANTAANTRITILEASNNAIFGNLASLTVNTGSVRDLSVLTTNVSILEASNTILTTTITNLTTNVTTLESTSNAFSAEVANLTSNVVALETSNGDIFGNLTSLTVDTGSVRDLSVLTTNVSILEASNGLIFGNLSLLTVNTGSVRDLTTLTTNVALLELTVASNNNLTLLQSDVADLEAANTAANTRITILEASNNAIFGNLALLTANTTGNVRSLSTLTVNVSILEASNATSFNTANTLRSDFEAANTAANTRITILEGANTTSFNTANTLRNDFEAANTAANTRISILEGANTTSFNTANTLRNDFDFANTRIVDLESANTAANTRISILETSNGLIFGNLALLTANTTGNVRSLSTLTVNVSALEASNTALDERVVDLETVSSNNAFNISSNAIKIANNVFDISNNAMDTANNAETLANNALIHANNALAAANNADAVGILQTSFATLATSTPGNVASFGRVDILEVSNNALDERVVVLEASNTTSSNTVNTLRSDFDFANTRIVNLEAANTAANTRITILEASNNAIFGNLALLTANTGSVRDLTTLTTNVSILEVSNTASFNTANTLRNDFDSANTAANTRITILEASNTASFNTANTLRNDFEAANTAANTRISILETSNGLIFGNLALLTSNTTGNVRSLSTLTVNVSALEAANTAANTRISVLEVSSILQANVSILEEANTASFNTANTLRNDFEAANTAANTRISVLEVANNDVYGNLALLTSNTTGNVRSLSTLTVNVNALETSNTNLSTDFANGADGSFTFRGTEILTGGSGAFEQFTVNSGAAYIGATEAKLPGANLLVDIMQARLFALSNADPQQPIPTLVASAFSANNLVSAGTVNNFVYSVTQELANSISTATVSANSFSFTNAGSFAVNNTVVGTLTANGIDSVYANVVEQRIGATDLIDLSGAKNTSTGNSQVIVVDTSGTLSYLDYVPAGDVTINLSSRDLVSFRSQTVDELVYKAVLFRNRQANNNFFTTTFDYNATRANTVSFVVVSNTNISIASAELFEALDLTTIVF